MVRRERRGERGLERLAGQAGASGFEGGLSCEEVAERLVQVRRDDVLVAHVELGEDGLVEPTSDLVGGGSVQLLGVLEEREGLVEILDPSVQIDLDTGQLQADALAVVLDLPKASPNASLRNIGIGRQIEEVLLLSVEGTEPLTELGPQQRLGAVLVRGGLCHQLAHRRDEVGVVMLDAVEALDGIFDSEGVVVRLVAVTRTTSRTEEVPVLATVAAGGFLKNQPLVDAELLPALAAEDRALEVVVMLPATLARVAP